MSSHSDSGLRGLLKVPFIYHGLQLIFGIRRAWRTLVFKYIAPRNGLKILDIGSGTSGILEYLHGYDVEYHGYDLNEDYIIASKRKWGDKGRYYFHAASVNDLKVEAPGTFDAVLAINLLHHLDDAEVDKLVDVAFASLKNSGKLITCDPCLFPRMNLVEKIMAARDRGRNIRTKEQYLALAKRRFARIDGHIECLSNVPQRGLIMECFK